MTRILALLGAAALVLGAVVVRSAIDGDGDDGSGNGGGSGAGSMELICGTALAAACNILTETTDVNVTIEAEADTVARIASGERTLGPDDVWLAAGPWPEIAAAAEEPLGLAGSDVLADSPAVIVALDDRMAAMEGACGEVTWACIGAQAGGQWADLGGDPTWGRVEVGLPDPTGGDGTVAVNQAVASEVGTTDFASNDIDDDPAVSAWFDRLASESKANASGSSPLASFLAVPGSLGVVGALEAESVTALERAASASSVRTVAPQPVARASVQLWSSDDEAVGSAIDSLGRDRLVAALEEAGWRVAGEVADDSGLPAPGVMAAVNQRWENVR